MEFLKNLFSNNNTNAPIIWEGDLDDDCIARWNGLVLRAEWMDEELWWWAVSFDKYGGDEIDSSNNYDVHCIGGENARKSAEHCAKIYIENLASNKQ